MEINLSRKSIKEKPPYQKSPLGRNFKMTQALTNIFL